MSSSRFAEFLRILSEEYERDEALVLSSWRAQHNTFLEATRADLSRRIAAAAENRSTETASLEAPLVENTSPDTPAIGSRSSDSLAVGTRVVENRATRNIAGETRSPDTLAIGSRSSDSLAVGTRSSENHEAGVTREGLVACIRALYGEAPAGKGLSGSAEETLAARPRAVTKEEIALEVRRLYGF